MSGNKKLPQHQAMFPLGIGSEQGSMLRIVSHGRFERQSREEEDPDMKEAFSIFWRKGFEEEAGAGLAMSKREAMSVVADFFKEIK